jgi:hypothetical protein
MPPHEEEEKKTFSPRRFVDTQPLVCRAELVCIGDGGLGERNGFLGHCGEVEVVFFWFCMACDERYGVECFVSISIIGRG